MKPNVALYVGGMGAREMNFHKQVYARMGYEKEVEEIQDLRSIAEVILGD